MDREVRHLLLRLLLGYQGGCLRLLLKLGHLALLLLLSIYMSERCLLVFEERVSFLQLANSVFLSFNVGSDVVDLEPSSRKRRVRCCLFSSK